MKNLITVLSVLLFLCETSAASKQKDMTNGLKIVKAFVVTDPKGDTKDDLKILLYVKNVSDFAFTLLTHNLQQELHLYIDKPKELFINLSTSKNIDGAKVIPSLPDFSPVMLYPGEVAEIEHFYRDKKDLKEIVLVYDMLNDWSDRFKTWKGRIQSKVIKIKKHERK